MLDLSLVIGSDFFFFLLATVRPPASFKQGHYTIQFIFVKDKGLASLWKDWKEMSENKDRTEVGQKRGQSQWGYILEIKSGIKSTC